MTLLIPVALLVMTMVVAVVGRHLVAGRRQRRLGGELGEDWWPAFERDLREYMSHTWSSAREAERRL
jgi:hypothetical protein